MGRGHTPAFRAGREGDVIQRMRITVLADCGPGPDEVLEINTKSVLEEVLGIEVVDIVAEVTDERDTLR